MVEGVAGVTSGLWTLRDGVKGPGREKEVLGSWVLAVLLTMSGRRGRMPWAGWSGHCLLWDSVNRGLYKVLCRAINKLRVKQIARISVPQHISLTDWVRFFSPEMGVFQKRRRKGRLGRGRWVGEDSCQLLCGSRTALADVGTATLANSLSLRQFTTSQDWGGSRQSGLDVGIPRSFWTQKLASLRMGSLCMWRNISPCTTLNQFGQNL